MVTPTLHDSGRVLILAISLAMGVAAPPALPQLPCSQGRLPAYAHNDYENRTPLADALRLGLRGVEADVFLVDGKLRLGHDRREARRRGADFEATYLAPLSALIQRCSGRLTTDGTPFLLTVELKEQSLPTFEALVTVLERYPVFSTTPPDALPAIEVVLVGWHPEPETFEELPVSLAVQYLVTRNATPADLRPGMRVRLLSLNYGHVVRRRWRRDVPAAVWQARLAELRRVYPEARVRVFNVPPDARLYRELLGAGVELIGTEDVEATTRLLESRGRAQ